MFPILCIHYLQPVQNNKNAFFTLLTFSTCLTLHKFVVVVREHLRVDLTDQFHDHADDDDETGARDNQILPHTREVREDEWQHGKKTEERASPQIQVITDFRKHRRRLRTRTNARHETAALLNIFRDFGRLERHRDVEIREGDREQEVEEHVPDARILRVEIRINEGHNSGEARCRLQELRQNRRKRNERHREDDWHHAGLVQADRQSTLHAPTCTLVGIGNRNQAVRIRKEHHGDKQRQGHDAEHHHESGLRLLCEEEACDACWNGCNDTDEDEHGDTVPNSLFADHFAEPHQEHRPCCDKQHRKENARERGIDEIESATAEQDQEAVALDECKRHAQPTRVAVQTLLALDSFLGDGFKLRENYGAELNDDRRIDVRSESEEHHGEVIDGTTRKRGEYTKHSAGCTLLQVGLQREWIHTRHRQVREYAVHNENAEGDQNASAQILGVPELSQKLKHEQS